MLISHAAARCLQSNSPSSDHFLLHVPNFSSPQSIQEGFLFYYSCEAALDHPRLALTSIKIDSWSYFLSQMLEFNEEQVRLEEKVSLIIR